MTVFFFPYPICVYKDDVQLIFLSAHEFYIWQRILANIVCCEIDWSKLSAISVFRCELILILGCEA